VTAQLPLFDAQPPDEAATCVRPLVWLDLCSGLGGASQPALDRGWKVVRVDIDPRFRPEIVADVRTLEADAQLDRLFRAAGAVIDVLWASPPCDEFSKWGLRCFNPNPPKPDLSIALAVHRIIDILHPRFWAVENVWAARPFLNPIFGPVRARPPGHAIWSDLGFLLPPLKAHKGSAQGKRWGTFGTKSGGDGKGKRRNAAESAVIPYEIGEAICAAVERRVSEEHDDDKTI
jgi:hypothetical protein